MSSEQSAAAVHLVVSQLTAEAAAEAIYTEARRKPIGRFMPQNEHGMWMVGRDGNPEDPIMFRHWALKIRNRYFELGRVHEDNSVVFEANSIDEPARLIQQINMMGYTHYSEDEICTMGQAVARDLKTYSLLSNNCQTLSSRILVKILCQDRSHNHDFYFFAPEVIKAGVSDAYKEDLLYFTMIHSNAYIGSAFATLAAVFRLRVIGWIVFLGMGYFFIKWIVTKPFKTLLGLVGIMAVYNRIILYGPTGFRT